MWLENSEGRLNIWDAQDEVIVLEERLTDIRDLEARYYDRRHDDVGVLRLWAGHHQAGS
jgi:hypothetical protein